MSNAAWASFELHQVVAPAGSARRAPATGSPAALSMNPLEAVDLAAQVASRSANRLVGQPARQRHVADAEVRRCSGRRRRRTGRTWRRGSSARRTATCSACEKYAGSPAGAPRLVGDDRAQARVEADERPAADRDARRRAGHHVVVAGAVVALVVADRADDRRACRRSPPAASCARRTARPAILRRRSA